MEKEFVNFEIALALKELGFNEPCFGRIYADGGIELLSYLYKNSDQIGEGTSCSASLYQQVFTWFREQFNWQASIEATKDQHSHELGYNYWIWNSETGLEYHTMPMNKPSGDWEFKTYEEAELACLLKLIETFKNETE
jgi:hypothetical protein